MGALQLLSPGTRGDFLGAERRAGQKRRGSMMLLLCEIQTWQEKHRHGEGHGEKFMVRNKIDRALISGQMLVSKVSLA